MKCSCKDFELNKRNRKVIMKKPIEDIHNPMFYIIDSWMGTGKSTTAISMINQDTRRKYIVIVEYKEEIDRYIEACPSIDFQTPDDKYTKSSDFIRLVKEGKSIVTTHSLIQTVNITENELQILKNNDYIFIIDETLDVICPLTTVSDDIISMLNERYIEKDDDNNIKWIRSNDYTGDHAVWKDIIKSNRVKIIEGNEEFKNKPALIWVMNPKILSAADKVYVLTFNFDGSYMKPYLEINNFPYLIGHVENFTFVEGPEDRNRQKELANSRLHVLDHQINKIGDSRTALSKNWYKRASAAERKQVSNNTRNFFLNMMRCRSGDAIYTNFEEFNNSYPVRDYIGSFTACNLKATNKYAQTHSLAYLINVFMHPNIKKYFVSQNLTITALDEEKVALNQLMQRIWRSAIRNGEEVNLYLPSRRMREVLTRFLTETE